MEYLNDNKLIYTLLGPVPVVCWEYGISCSWAAGEPVLVEDGGVGVESDFLPSGLAFVLYNL